MSVTSFIHSWGACERNCFNYLQAALGTLEGVQGYTPENFPREMPGNEDYFYIWTFKISGGPVDVQRNARTEATGGTWHMNAEFVAVCATDEIAKQVGGTVIGALPALAADVTGLAKLYATEFPSVERTTRSLVTAQNAGEERVFFEVRIPMRVAFGNMEQAV